MSRTHCVPPRGGAASSPSAVPILVEPRRSFPSLGSRAERESKNFMLRDTFGGSDTIVPTLGHFLGGRVKVLLAFTQLFLLLVHRNPYRNPSRKGRCLGVREAALAADWITMDHGLDSPGEAARAADLITASRTDGGEFKRFKANTGCCEV